MKNLKMKLRERVLAAFLALAMIITMLPANAIAASEQYPDAFTITAKDEAGKVLQDVTVVYSVTDSDDAEITTETEAMVGEDGSIAIADVEAGYIVKYSLSKDGYLKAEGEYTVVDPTENLDVTLLKCKVTVAANEGGKVTVNGEEVANEGSISVDEGSTVKLAVRPDEGYQIKSVKVDDEEKDITDVKKFESDITDVAADVSITVEFVKVYKVTVTYNENGEVETDPACEAGEVVVEEGEKVKITATPNNGYRVSQVTINTIKAEVTTANNFTYDTTLEANQNYTVEVTFAPNIYQITVSEKTGDGTVSVGNKEALVNQGVAAEYGTEQKIILKAEDGYHLASLIVAGSDVTDKCTMTEEETMKYVISSVEDDIDVTVVFEKDTEVSVNDPFACEDYTITFSKEPVRKYVENGKTIVVLPGDESFTIKPAGDYEGGEVSLTGKNKSYTKDITVNRKNAEITDIENIYVRVKGRGGWWNNKTCANVNLQIKIDENAPTVSILPAEADGENQYYTKNFEVKIDVKAPDTNNGIQSIKYWVESGEATKYEQNFEVTSGTTDYSDTIEVDTEEIDSDNVYVKVQVIDVEDNIYYYSSKVLKVTQAPKVSLSIDGKSSETYSGCYQGTRTAKITVEDRLFEADNMKLDIKAQDLNNEQVDSPELGSWTQEGNKYTAQLVFANDAIYSWDLSYTNAAGLEVKTDQVAVDATSENPFTFTVDNTAPEKVTITDNETTWDKLISALTFGIWKNDDVTITAEATDNVSGVAAIWYYKVSTTDKDNLLDPMAPALLEEELDVLYEAGKFTETPYTVSSDETFVIYARAEDCSGNRCYVSTDGIIVDKVHSTVELIPDAPNGNGIYNKDVKVAVNVTDPAPYSGIKSITYQVLCDGEVTQKETLFTFDLETPAYEELQKEWNGTIKVNGEAHNSCDVEVIVTAVDNAGNEKSKSVFLDIDVTKPAVNVSYDNNAVNKIADGRGYFNNTRTATVIFTERKHHFNKEEAIKAIKAGITATDVKGEAVTLDWDKMLGAWDESENNTDADTHTITVTFDTDANYTFDISYTDEAGNVSDAVNWGESVTPQKFTVDTNAPEDVKITDGEHWWDKLLTILTFGIWKPGTVTVTAEATDSISPVEQIEYYKLKASSTSSTIEPLTLKALDKLAEDGEFKVKEDGYTIDNDETFVVYARIVDYAGNRCYINTDGIIVDKDDAEDCIIKLTPDDADVQGSFGEEDHYGYYNLNNDIVNIGVDVADDGSAIKSVCYEVKRDGVTTDSAEMFTFDLETPAYEKLQKEWNGTIQINRTANNSCDVEVIVTAVDNAGNEKSKSVFLDIDVIKPAVNVSYDNNAVNKIVDGRGYFDKTRTATVTFTERNHHFNKEEAIKAIKAGITATDVKGEAVTLDWDKMLGAWDESKNNTDADTHTITVTFDTDANYTFDISYTDEAGNVSDAVNWGTSVAPQKFTVDKAAPTGSVSAAAEDWQDVHEWKELIQQDKFSFGRWSKKGIAIAGTIADAISPVEDIQYYKVADKVAKTEEDLKKVTSWKNFGDGFTVLPNEQFTVYLKLTDYAGNVHYISTNGMIADNENPHEETIAPEVTVSPVQPVNDIYNTDVNVDIQVIDPKVGDTYSGLKEVKYEVLNMGTVTQSDTLYKFEKGEPKFEELQQDWAGKITVDKEKNNSNDVVIRIYAVDNAGNESEDEVAIKIDTTKPAIHISYDNNSSDSTKYYKNNRTATVVISERNFNAKDVKVTAVGGHGSKPAISGWTKKEGTGNLDDTTYTATIAYTADDDYTFAITYTDLAGNACPGELYVAGTTNPKEFTIDKTLPTMDVTYDNNSVLNENYYKEERTTTIRIVEHNFDTSRVVVQVNATDNGSAVSSPTVSGWSTSGDVHTATIHYANDALYTFNLAFTDMAGNQAAPFTTQTFYVDKTKPSVNITNIVDQSANTGKDKIGFVLTATDTNFDVFTPVLKAVVMENGKFVTKIMDIGVISNTANGKVYTVDNLDTDGIYHLTCTVVDKAGNAFEEVTLYDADGKAYQEKRTAQDDLVVFSVNRDGSTYELNSFTSNINGGYVYEVYEDIVFVEINADPLLKHAVTVNGKELKEGKDYTVTESAGEGLWHKYTYVIDKGYFSEEGEYSVVVSSVDKADSDAYSDVKGASVKFTVDKTAPVVTVSGLANDGRYQVEEQTVTVIPTDDGGKLKSMVCEILDRDGNLVETAIDLSGEEFDKALSEGDGKLTFTIGEGMYQQVHIICKDCALDDKGNTNTYDSVYKNVTVSSNAFKIFWANVALRYGVLIALAVVGGFIFFIIAKKKKEDEEA